LEVKGPVTFGPEADGVRFVGPGEISGGIELRNWTKATFNGREAWKASVPPGSDFRELFVGGARMGRPCVPAEGAHTFAAWAEPSDAKVEWNVGQTAAVLAHGDLGPSPRNLGDIELVATHLWVASRIHLASYDGSSGLARFREKSVFKLADDHGPGLGPYRLENVAEAFGRPGEWYLDRPAGAVYYTPRPGERMERFKAYAPGATALLRFEGVTGATVDSLTLRHAEYHLPEGSSGDVQAAFSVPGAVQLIGCHGVKVRNCLIEQVGTYGVQVAGSSSDCAIEGCRMSDLGAGGVVINSGPRATTVSDCVIEHGGRVFPSAIGILAQLSGFNRIEHNLIRDFYYTGISVGWDWGFADTLAQHNTIEYNEIEDIGQRQLSDMGGIYVLGKQPGSRIAHNRIRRVDSRTYGGWGIYLDEGSTGWTVEDNIVEYTKTGGFHIHYGGNNIVRHNVFAYARTEGQMIRVRDDKQGTIRFEHNLVVAEPGQAPLVPAGWLRRDVSLTGMLYAAPPQPVPFGDDGTARFISVRLGPDGVPTPSSEVYRMGFAPIETKSIGPRIKTP
jgi:parallel beta-helix repeat protein